MYGTYFDDILLEIEKFHSRKCIWKRRLQKWRPSCLCLSVLNGFQPFDNDENVASWYWAPAMSDICDMLYRIIPIISLLLPMHDIAYQVQEVDEWIAPRTQNYQLLLKPIIYRGSPAHMRDTTCDASASTQRQTSSLKTRRGRDKIAADWQTIFSIAFSWMNKVWISIKMSLKFVPKRPNNSIPALI